MTRVRASDSVAGAATVGTGGGCGVEASVMGHFPRFAYDAGSDAQGVKTKPSQWPPASQRCRSYEKSWAYRRIIACAAQRSSGPIRYLQCLDENAQAINREVKTMSTILIIIVLVLLFGGGGFYGYSRWR